MEPSNGNGYGSGRQEPTPSGPNIEGPHPQLKPTTVAPTPPDTVQRFARIQCGFCGSEKPVATSCPHCGN